MAAFRTATAVARSILNVYYSALSGGTLVFFSGPEPASADTPTTDRNVPLGILRFAQPLGVVAGDRSIELSLDEAPEAAADGVASFARAYGSGGDVVFQVDVGDEDNNPGAVILMNDVNIKRGGPIRVPSFTIFCPR